MYDPAFSQTIAALWGLEKEATITPFGTGLINHTWKVQSGGKAYILQRINQEVFRQPGAIAQNISRISQHLSQHAPQYRFVAPVKTTAGAEMSCDLPGCLTLLTPPPCTPPYRIFTTSAFAFSSLKQP
jgi:hypothetical protein